MMLFLLERRDTPDYDESLGFVVAARTTKAARRFAALHNHEDDHRSRINASPWLDTAATSCATIGTASTSVKAGIVLHSFLSG